MHMPTVSWRSKVLNDHRSKDFYFFMYIFGRFSQEFLLKSYIYACLVNPASASDNLIGLDFYRSPAFRENLIIASGDRFAPRTKLVNEDADLNSMCTHFTCPYANLLKGGAN